MVFVCIFFRSLSNPTTFHHLMVVLFLADCVYLFLALLHRIEILFEIELVLLTIIYPTFTYPMSSIILTMSIYLTVAMAHERYIAIKNPLSHQRDMMSSKYRRRMLFKYLFFSWLSSDLNLYWIWLFCNALSNCATLAHFLHQEIDF